MRRSAVHRRGLVRHDLEKRYPQLTLFIREVLAQDPRPAYRKGEETGKTYAVWLHDFNDYWRQIQLAPIDCKFSNIGNPLLVWPRSLEISLENIRGGLPYLSSVRAVSLDLNRCFK